MVLVLFWAAFHYSPIIKPFPKTTGSYSVGSTTHHWVDHNREEPYKKDSKGPRELVIRFWYPSHDVKKKKKFFPYMAEKLAPIKKDLKSYSSIPEFVWSVLLKNMKTDAILDAKISKTDLREREWFPVIIFSHGIEGYLDIYASFVEELSSHGYIVVGIDHVYGANISVLPDGRIVRMDRKLHDKRNLLDKEWMAKYAIGENRLWLGDIQFVLDKLKVINEDRKEKFYKKFDLERIGILGHSMGGITALEACRKETRLKVGISLDGWSCDVNSVNKLDKPFLFLFGEKSLYSGLEKNPSYRELKVINMSFDEYKEWAKMMRRDSRQFCSNCGRESYKITIKGAGHGAFSDMVLLKCPLGKLLSMNIGKVDSYNVIKIIRQYSKVFFDKYLCDGDLSLFDVFDASSREKYGIRIG